MLSASKNSRTELRTVETARSWPRVSVNQHARATEHLKWKTFSFFSWNLIIYVAILCALVERLGRGRRILLAFLLIKLISSNIHGVLFRSSEREGKEAKGVWLRWRFRWWSRGLMDTPFWRSSTSIFFVSKCGFYLKSHQAWQL